MFFRIINLYMVFQPSFRDAFSKRVHHEFQAPKLPTENKKMHYLGAKQDKMKNVTTESLALSEDGYDIIDRIPTEPDEDTVLV